MTFTLNINGNTHSVDVDDDMPLLWVLRDVLGMTGTKFGCGIAQCGACTVHIDGKPVRSCLLRGRRGRESRRHHHRRHRRDAGRRESAESLARSRSHPVRLLPVGPDHVGSSPARRHAAPDDSDIDAAMAGNICRCGTYVRIRAAIKRAAASGSHRRRAMHVS